VKAQAAALPTVSVVMPCLDEEAYVGEALANILAGSYPAHLMEVLVVEGRSRDKTRAILDAVAAGDRRVRVLDNPRGTTPAALNIGIRAARAELIVRVDAHTAYPPDYVESLVRALLRTGADMVGPCSEATPASDRPMARAIAIAVGSAFGSGSPFRYQRTSGPADAVPYGCWRRELFDRVGLFDERLLRNQDNEHSSRILKSGGRVHMAAEICVRNHPRPTLIKLWRQARATGMWNAFTQRLFPYTFRWRHTLPGVFFLGVLFAAACVAVGAAGAPASAAFGAAVLIPYLAANLFASVALALRSRRPHYAPLLAAILASYHFAYGYGIAKGWLLVATGAWRSRLGGAPKESRLR
jgi:glycosyltransferase involved in cell wall biosynthesis